MFYVEVFENGSDIPIESHHYAERDPAIRRFNTYCDILEDYKLFDHVLIRQDNVVLFDTKGFF